MNCQKCGEIVVDQAVCGQCRSELHYLCAGITQSAQRKAAWRCTICLPCASAGYDAAQITVADILRQIQCRDSVERTQPDLSTQMEAINTKLDALNSQTVDLHTRMSRVEFNFSIAQDDIAALKQELNVKDQYSRMNNVEISGVPYTQGENPNVIIYDIGAKLNFSFMFADVDTVYRVRRFVGAATAEARQPPAIIVRFTQRHRKDALLAAARARPNLTTAHIGIDCLSQNIYLNEHLTPTNKLLLKRAKQLKERFNYGLCWVHNCTILMRKNNGPHCQTLRITKESDLLQLTD